VLTWSYSQEKVNFGVSSPEYLARQKEDLTVSKKGLKLFGISSR
jgi:hypothetical protein